MPTDFETQVDRIQKEIGYEFGDLSLLHTALTHKSYANEAQVGMEDNQRLEFLGDAVLGLVVAEVLMQRLTSEPEGILTRWRSALVNESSLAELGRAIALGDALLLGHGEQMSNGRDRASTVSDAVEALIGAVYLDGGFDAARTTVIALFADKLKAVSEGVHPTDVKGALQEILQSRQASTPVYRLVKEEGPDHAKVFEVAISIDDNIISIGRGRSKKEAEKNAARKALSEVNK